MRILFEVAGEKQIERELLRTGAYATDAQPAFNLIGELLMRETGEQFASEGRHASGGWVPLKPATVLFKQQHGFRPQILQRTGDLLASLTVRGDSNLIFEPGPQQLVYGTKLPYALPHQRPKPGSPLPRRRPFEFTEATRREAVKILQRWILTGELPR